jgi:integrase/recombinase XerD
LVKMVGSDGSFISQMMKGSTVVSIKTIQLLLDEFGVSANYILSGIKLPEIFSQLKTNWHRSGVTFLTIDELRKLKNYYETVKTIQPQSALTSTIRFYLFSCHTGLRISDMFNLASANNIENVLHINIAKHQLGKPKALLLPLNQYAKNLWTEIVLNNFNHPAEQTMNKILKNIAPDLQIQKHLTYHTSRHTFATSLLRLGGKLHDVKDLMGHSNIKTTMIYAHVTNEDLITSVNLMNAL